MRNRTKGSKSFGTVKSYSSGNLIDTQATYYAASDEASIYDEKHPEWQFVQGRRVVMGECSIRRQSLSSKWGVAVFPPQTSNQGVFWGGREFQGNMSVLFNGTGMPLVPEWFLNDLVSARTMVVNRAFAKAYDSKANVLVTAAELHKTIGMVRRPFGKVRDLLFLITRRYRNLLSKGVNAVQAAQNAWLEYRLGWKPLLFDIENIGKAVAKQMTTVDFSHLAVYRSHVDRNWSGSATIPVALYPAVGSLERKENIKAKVAAGVILRENLFDESSHPWQRTFGVELHDVAASVWELLPYSFVVDRFVEVQTWLTAIQPRPNTSVEGSWQTTVVNSETSLETLDLSMTINFPGDVRVLRAVPGDLSVDKVFTLDRVKNVAPSMVPALNVSDLNLNQHLDHAALIVAQIIGLFPEVGSKAWSRKNK